MTISPKKGLQRPDIAVGDQLFRLLSKIQLTASTVAEFSIGAGRGLAMQGPPYFFMVLEGECWLHEEGGEPVHMEPGDSVVGLRGDLARLSLTSDVTIFDDIAQVWRASGSSAVSLHGYDMPLRLVCGESGSGVCRLMGSALIFSRSTCKSRLIEEAPPIIRLSADEAHLRYWAAAVSDMLERNDGDARPGSAMAGTALSQFLLIEQIKAYLMRDRAAVVASMGGGKVENIWKLIRTLQQDPARSWSIASMAREAAMSRTSFIQAFREASETTPFRFLAACRMNYAAELLKTSQLSIEEIGTQSGYHSQHAFREAFWQAFGSTPHAFRKMVQMSVEPPFPHPSEAGRRPS